MPSSVVTATLTSRRTLARPASADQMDQANQKEWKGQAATSRQEDQYQEQAATREKSQKDTFNEDDADAVATKAQNDFFWTYTEEPHRTRRHAIIKAHPEVLKLCGIEPRTKYLVLLVVGIQIACAYLLRSTPFFSWRFLLTAYVVGATANQNLFLAIHEISHNLAFKSASANRYLAILANLPIGIPYSASFRPYHLTHHKSLGIDGLDVDVPTPLEALLLNSVAGKAFFCTFQILFYAVRPVFVYRLPFTRLHLLNVGAQLAFDALLVRACDAGAGEGWTALAYLLLSSFLAGSLHPCAGHFIAEHYVFPQSATPARRPAGPTGPAGAAGSAGTTSADEEKEKQEEKGLLPVGTPPPETYSYYGALNALTYNVGLHNEHHDFPAVPWSRLPQLNRIAREFYDPLPCHRSWVGVMWMFVFGGVGGGAGSAGNGERAPAGLWSRVKRRDEDAAGRKVGAGWSQRFGTVDGDDQGE